MATWKKVIVSGSDAELNTLFTSLHVTSSANISASGFLYGNLPENNDLEYVVIYNDGGGTHNGRLERKLLNLINTQAAPNLFIIDQFSPGDHDQHFRLSHAPGNTNLTSLGVSPYIQLSASLDGGLTYTRESGSNLDYVGLNEEWSYKDLLNQLWYSPSTNLTSSFLEGYTYRDGLDVGQENTIDRTFQFQAISNTNTAVPEYDSNDFALNYGNRAFNNGGIGKLEFYVNDNDTPVRIFDLEANLDVVSADSAGGIEINLFATQSNLDGDTGDPDPSKHYRSGSFVVERDIQRDGYNFAYAIHTGSIGGSDFVHVTNFSEWFYDLTGSVDNVGMGRMYSKNQGILGDPVFDMSLTSSISGIKFFDTDQDGAVLKYGAEIANQYRNVYPVNGGIQINDITGDTVSSISVIQNGSSQVQTTNSQNVGTGDAVDLTYDLAELQNVAGANNSTTQITASVNIGFSLGDTPFYQPSGFDDWFTTDNIENNDHIVSFTPKFTHINGHKSDLTLNQVTIGDYMLNQMSDPDTDISKFEAFRYETYRIESASYTDVTVTESISTIAWDGEKNIVNGGDGYNKGLIQYYSHLLYPTGAGVGGEFDVSFGPTGSGVQPTNYSSATGEREYFRYFKLGSNVDGEKTVNIELVGSGKVVLESSNFFSTGDDGIKIYAWKSSRNASYTGNFKNVTDTGFRIGDTLNANSYIPLASNAAAVNYSESANQNINGQTGISVPNGVVKFADNTINGVWGENDFLFVRIVVPQNFSGYINSMAITFGSNPSKIHGTAEGNNL